jgi:tetratricopeptide (TPR) repeat protein
MGANWWRADALFKKGLAAGTEQGGLSAGIDLVTEAGKINPYKESYFIALSQMAMLQVDQELVKPQSAERDSNVQNLIAGAINIAKQATDINERNADGWIQRGIIYRSVLGYLNGAEDWMLSSFSEAAKLQPKNPYVFWEFGRSYSLLADYVLATAGSDQTKQEKATQYLNQAEEQFNKAIAVKSDYAQAHYQLALIYDRLGKVGPAIEKMEITKANFPSDTGVAFQLGLLYYKNNDLQKARGEFERAILLDPNYSNARYFLGLIYDKQGEDAKALEQFRRVAELNPDNQEVKTILTNLEEGNPALEGIAPPGESPDNRGEAPVE